MNNTLPWRDTGQQEDVIRQNIEVYTPRGFIEAPSPKGIDWVERMSDVSNKDSIKRVWNGMLAKPGPPMIDKGGNLVCPWIQGPGPDEYSDTEF